MLTRLCYFLFQAVSSFNHMRHPEHELLTTLTVKYVHTCALLLVGPKSAKHPATCSHCRGGCGGAAGEATCIAQPMPLLVAGGSLFQHAGHLQVPCLVIKLQQLYKATHSAQFADT